MASNREERLQMRQRGAASRKTKAIDFGFSFGLPTASDEPSQSTSRPDNVGISLFPPVPPPASMTDTAVNTTTPVAATEPEITQPSIISPERKLSAQEGPIRRTPGSARNKLPPRPSPYDLPTEDPPEVGPSRKIRKLDHSRRTSTISFSARDEESSQPLNNGVASIAAPQSPPKPTSPPALNGTQHSQEELSTTHVLQEDPAPLQPPQLAEPVAPDHATEPPPEPQQEPQAKSTPSPPGEETRGKRKRRTSRDSDVSSRRSPRGSPQNAVSPKAADVEGSQVSAAMDTSPDGKSPVTASPKIAAPNTTGSHDDTTQDVTEPQATSESQIPAAQISSEEETTAAGKTTQPRIASEAEATGSPIASEPPEAAEPQDAVEPKETNGIGKATEPHSTTTQTESPTPPRTKRTREQRAASVQPHSTTAKQSRVVRAGSAESAPVQGMERKRLRGRIGKNQEPMPSIPTIEEEPADDTGATVSSQPKDGTVTKGSRQSRLPRPTTVADKKSTRAGRPGRKPARSQDIQEEVPMREEEAQQPEEQQHEPEPESKAVTEPEAYLQPEARTEPKPSRPVRRGRGRKPLPENTDDAQASNEEIPAQAEQAEPETEVQPAQQTEPPKPAKRGRGRPLPAKRARGRKPASKEKDDTTQAADEEATVQDEPAEPTEEAPPPKKRKPRQPRGETVPVTVHRFVNATALGEGPEPEESSDEEEESAEGLTAKQKTKLVSRGGVNAADVLSQICRETLEKTLATLKNGIANEGNAARRAEWTRKKKAVEAYGTELEGRLFELSEMLDSNFVLGRQIKKSKREMMDLRSRLYRVRKEREDVALQMDAVRRKHSEEENAKMARSTINNSLHSLDLALERSRNRPVDESTSQNPEPSSTAGLEFLVRNVAENVSSIAPGAQGGLLHQIKSFNAQLEATARRLES
ncbi:Fungal specific transcription factor domain family protein [Aspergillus niger]|uniref:Fungal specific transcription factor domain family protein n=1 Tax=Aspergillus niger TaxID=5061 RepID=A0A505IIY6_ASPNG|nr:Fungal specific transcription factor domain family protein [Aspergillus niger]